MASEVPAGVHVPVERLARAHDLARPHARLKARVEDFRVDEILGFEPLGRGEHAWLRVEKRDLDTLEVMRAIARQVMFRVGWLLAMVIGTWRESASFVRTLTRARTASHAANGGP